MSIGRNGPVTPPSGANPPAAGWRVGSCVLVLALVVGAGCVVFGLTCAVERVREGCEQPYISNNLRQVGFALLEYHERHGHLPPAALYGKDGRPLLSWRVLILPFLEQGGLYRRFKLDKPWDSPHNKKLLEQMPEVYALPPSRSDEAPPYYTVFQVFVGKGAAFDGGKGLRLPQDFPDGQGDTILVALASKPVPWTKPEDLAYDPSGPLPGLRKLFRHGSPVLMADTSVRWLKADASEASIRAAVTRNGGDKLGPDWDQ